jgi:hypothetical protein
VQLSTLPGNTTAVWFGFLQPARTDPGDALGNAVVQELYFVTEGEPFTWVCYAAVIFLAPVNGYARFSLVVTLHAPL